jgi:hypothetical protein
MVVVFQHLEQLLSADVEEVGRGTVSEALFFEREGRIFCIPAEVWSLFLVPGNEHTNVSFLFNQFDVKKTPVHRP